MAEWIRRFREGRTSLKDDPRAGRPVTEANYRNIAIVRALIDENPRISIRYIVFLTSLSYGNVSRIIHDDLKLKKLCARWLPLMNCLTKPENNALTSAEIISRNYDLVNGASVTL